MDERNVNIDPEEVFESIVSGSKSVIISSKKLIESILTQESTEEEVYMEIENLFDITDQLLAEISVNSRIEVLVFPEKEKSKSSSNYGNFGVGFGRRHRQIVMAGDELKEVIKTMVLCAKEALNNRYDFLTTDKLRLGSVSVAKSIKKIVVESEGLKNYVLDFSNNPGLMEVGASSGNGAVEVQWVTDDDLANLADETRGAVSALSRLKACSVDKESDGSDLVQAAQETSASITLMIITAKEYELKEQAEILKESTVGMINAAKILFKDPEDEVFRRALDQAFQKVADSIKKMVSKVKDMHDNTVPPPSPSPDLFKQRRESKQLRRSITVKSIPKPSSSSSSPSGQIHNEGGGQKNERLDEKNNGNRAGVVRDSGTTKHVPPQPPLPPLPPLPPEAFAKKSEQESRPLTASEKHLKVAQQAIQYDFLRTYESLIGMKSDDITPDFTVISGSPGTPPKHKKTTPKSQTVAHMASTATSKEVSDDLNQKCLLLSKEFAQCCSSMILQCYAAFLQGENADTKALGESVSAAVDQLRKLLEVGVSLSGSLQTLDTAFTKLYKFSTRGTPIEEVIKGVANNNSVKSLILINLQEGVCQRTWEIRCLSIQFYAIAAGLEYRTQPGSEYSHSSSSRVLAILGAAVLAWINCTESLLNTIETARFVASTALERIDSHEMIGVFDLVVPPSDPGTVEEVNIWDDLTIFRAGKQAPPAKTFLKHGSLNRLVYNLTHEDNSKDSHFLPCFLATLETFSTPEQLLHKLLERHRVPNYVHLTAKHAIQKKICKILDTYVMMASHNMTDDFLSKLQEYCRIISIEQAELAENLKKNLEEKVEERLELLSGQLLKTPPVGIFFPQLGSSSKDLVGHFLSLSPLEVARQFTLIDFKHFEAIQPNELLGQCWNKFEKKHVAPNVVEMIERANKMAFWVATMILSEDTAKGRSRLITHMIEIAEQMKVVGNFNSLMGIVAGMNVSSVTRLKQSMNEVSVHSLDMLRQLEKLMSPNSSYKNYRTSLHKRQPPCLPYVGVYLIDLTFIDEGNPNMTKKGEINFQKRELIYKTITEIQKYQQKKFDFPPLEPVQSFLSVLPASMERDLYNLSLVFEPRNLTEETIKSPRTHVGSERRFMRDTIRIKKSR